MSHRNGQHDHSNRFDDTDPPPSRKGQPSPGGNAKSARSNGAPESRDGPAARRLSEISHLFLTDLRNASGHGREPPKRIPPGARNAEKPTIQPTPQPAANDLGADDTANFSVPPISAVIGARLGGTLLERASQYASGLADELPVGLLVVEEGCLRLISVAQGNGDAEPASAEVLDDISLRAALMEMSCDIARWLVVLPDPRLPQARWLLGGIREWVLLVPAEHEGVVSAYRVLKGLCDLELPTGTDAPRVTLAFVDAANAKATRRHARRLVGVCKQFLDLDVETADVEGAPAPGAVSSIGAFIAREVGVSPWIDGVNSPIARVLEEVLISDGGANEPLAPEDFENMAEELPETSGPPPMDSPAPPRILESAIPPIARPAPTAGFFADDWVSANEDLSRLERRSEPRKVPEPSKLPPSVRSHIFDLEIPELALPLSPSDGSRPAARRIPEAPQIAAQTPSCAPQAARSAFSAADALSAVPHVGPRVPAAPLPQSARPTDSVVLSHASASDGGDAARVDDVIDLPAGRSVAGAVSLRLSLAETPIAPPMLAGSSLCISREGGIVLVAAAAPGLEDLPTIGRALTWASENRGLLRMALTQFRVDESPDVRLHLLVSRADVSADTLRPLMSTGRVTVQAYRRLSWGGRSGLLLEAA